MSNTAGHKQVCLEFDDNELRIWLLGEHRDEKDDYAGYTKILDEARIVKKV